MYDYVLIMFFLLLPIIKKMGLNMSNYNDNKNIDLTMHHTLPKWSLSMKKNHLSKMMIL